MSTVGVTTVGLAALIPILLMALVLGGALLLMALVIFLLFRLARGAQTSRQLGADEAQMLQETWQQLERFEQRLTNLETILITRSTAARADER